MHAWLINYYSTCKLHSVVAYEITSSRYVPVDRRICPVRLRECVPVKLGPPKLAVAVLGHMESLPGGWGDILHGEIVKRNYRSSRIIP